MSGASFRTTLDDAGARSAFAALRGVTENLQPVLEDVGAELESSTVLRFETNVAPDGTAWTPSEAAMLRGSPTLVEQGHLRDSVHYEVDRNAVEISEGGIAGAYASLHQLGIDEDVEVRAYERAFTQVFGRPVSGTAHVKAHTRHMKAPARPSLGISTEDAAAIADIVVDHWRGAIIRGLG